MSSLSRRALLRGLALGGAGAFLGPLVGRLTQAEAQTQSPRRFVIVVEGNGYEPVTVLSAAARAALDATLAAPVGTRRWWYGSYRHAAPLVVPDLSGASALGTWAGLDAVRAQTTVLLGLSSRVAGGGHSAQHGALASARTIARVPGGPTIDAWLGAQAAVRGAAPLDVVRVGVSGSSQPLDFGTCAFARGRAAPLILGTTAAYDATFGSVGSASGRAAFAARASLLDFAREDVRRAIAAFPGSGAERAKLETYLASVEELGRRQQRITALEAQLTAARPAPPDVNPLHASSDPLDRFRAQLEIVGAALVGELTRVAVVGCGSGGAFDLRYTSVSPDVSRHDLHHGSGSNPEFLRRIHEVTRLQVSAILELARRLAETPETGASGSMLDHTVLVFVGDNGEQHHSTASEFPILLVGGRALGHAGGDRTLLYPGLSAAGHRQLSNLWNTLGYLAGGALDDFGLEGPTRRARGPLTELLA